MDTFRNGSRYRSLIISGLQDWLEYDQQFFDSIGNLGIVGLDCEWVDPCNWEYKEQRENPRSRALVDEKRNALRISNGSSGKVALLQLATHGGLVVLIRLCFFQEVPDSLKMFLENPYMLKLGVNIESDARKLFTDWNINMAGFVDLRNIVVRSPRFLEEYQKSGLGLKKLGNFLTGIQCNESNANVVRYSHWAANELNSEQIAYARDDAAMALDGYIAYAHKYMDDAPHPGNTQRFFDHLRNVLYPHANRTCSDYAMTLLNETHIASMATASEKAAVKKEEKRRRRQLEREGPDAFDSDVELDFERWKRKSDRGKHMQMQEAIDRAVLFRTDDQRELAAIDGQLLDALKAVSQPQELTFDVKNRRGEPIFEVKMKLQKQKVVVSGGSTSKIMDEQLVNDFVAATMNTRVKELQEECDQLQSRLGELEAAHERKQEEIARLRHAVENEQHLKQSALSKLAQLEVAGPTASGVSTVDHWLATAASFASNDKESEPDTTSGAGSGSGNSADHDFQRRLLELELQLVSKERENLMKHKVIIDHFEKILEEKRLQIEAKDEEIRGMRAEVTQKQSQIDQLRLEHGFTMRTAQSPSSALSTALSSK